MFRYKHKKSRPQEVTRDDKDVAVQYVYHRKSPDFVGDWVVPLNKMPALSNFEAAYKSIYEHEKNKYKGREYVTQWTVPPLGNCKWNDVNFLSPIHPHYIYQEFQRIGIHTDQSSWKYYFKIPISKLNLDPSVTTMWSHSVSSGKQLSPDSFCKIDADTYRELDELPDATIKYYQDEFVRRGKVPLFFAAVPHILTTEPINITEGVSVVDWKDPKI